MVDVGLASDLKGHIRGVLIANEAGNFLVEANADKSYNSSLISAFVAGLTQLGRQNLGNLHEITIKGEDMNLVVAFRGNLMVVTIFDPNVDASEIQDEAPSLLEYFAEVYKNQLDNWDGNQEIFEDFAQALRGRIRELLARTVQSKEELFGKLFSTRLVEKPRDQFPAPNVARVCHRCRVYVIIQPDDPANQRIVAQFEMVHANHLLGLADLSKLRDATNWLEFKLRK